MTSRVSSRSSRADAQRASSRLSRSQNREPVSWRRSPARLSKRWVVKTGLGTGTSFAPSAWEAEAAFSSSIAEIIPTPMADDDHPELLQVFGGQFRQHS